MHMYSWILHSPPLFSNCNTSQVGKILPQSQPCGRLRPLVLASHGGHRVWRRVCLGWWSSCWANGERREEKKTPNKIKATQEKKKKYIYIYMYINIYIYIYDSCLLFFLGIVGLVAPTCRIEWSWCDIPSPSSQKSSTELWVCEGRPWLN